VWTYPAFGRDIEPSILMKINTEESLTPLFRRQLGPISLFYEIPGFDSREGRKRRKKKKKIFLFITFLFVCYLLQLGA
jgi:hypothetical protein